MKLETTIRPVHEIIIVVREGARVAHEERYRAVGLEDGSYLLRHSSAAAGNVTLAKGAWEHVIYSAHSHAEEVFSKKAA